ncbi:hypothetical protein PspLS_06567 [Pyricularia sp. CBS 133598]|nr:hypothetical protein PspLS_06573 [Pyricularia sp. CBS 133598]TLD24119.1 hypothetical protein PspLS_06567 [Pyricularia sp. CBS 133598]
MEKKISRKTFLGLYQYGGWVLLSAKLCVIKIIDPIRL